MQTWDTWYKLDKDQMSIVLYEPEGQLGLENARFPPSGTIDRDCGNLW